MPSRPRVIAFIVAPPVDLLNLIGIASVFSYPVVEGKPSYALKILSTSSEPEVQGMAGISVSNGVLFSEYNGPIDTLIAISGEGALGQLSPDLFRWIRKRAARVRRIASVCTGTFMLAPTGVLDGKRITTHWHHVDKLTKLYPHLRVEKDPIYIKDGNVYTTAGVTAGIDLALGFVEEDLGHEVATSIARELVLYMRRPGSEAQYSTILSQQADVSGTPMRDLPAWAMARLNQRLDVHSLAKVVAMTPRTFARQFELHFRTTPARWLQSLRVEAACGHLEAQALPVKAIARLTGFRDEQSLRRAFVQQLSMTPREYREQFGAFMASDLRSDFQGEPAAT